MLIARIIRTNAVIFFQIFSYLPQKLKSPPAQWMSKQGPSLELNVATCKPETILWSLCWNHGEVSRKVNDEQTLKNVWNKKVIHKHGCSKLHAWSTHRGRLLGLDTYELHNFILCWISFFKFSRSWLCHPFKGTVHRDFVFQLWGQNYFSSSTRAMDPLFSPLMLKKQHMDA